MDLEHTKITDPDHNKGVLKKLLDEYFFQQKS